VRGVRRPAVLVLTSGVFATSLLALTAGPASAHICSRPAEILVGRTQSIAVGVTVEDATVPDVEIDIPPGLHLDHVDAKPGWSFRRAGSTVRYRGGPITRFRCEDFSLGVTAAAKGTFGIAVVQRTASGKIVARTNPDPNRASDRLLDQFVYAGVKPPSTDTGGSSGPSAATIGGIALVGLGVILAGGLGFRAWRNRRAEPDDEAETGADELQARLDAFKKRKPDPPARPASG
jgi:hypothetical protein